jgi:hypothetical protein
VGRDALPATLRGLIRGDIPFSSLGT